jgi:hypothetical protein
MNCFLVFFDRLVGKIELESIDPQNERFKWIEKKMSKSIGEHNGQRIDGYEILKVNKSQIKAPRWYLEITLK